MLPVMVQAFDAQQWQPAVDPQGYFSVYSAKTAPQGRFYIGLWGSYAKDTLNIRPGRGTAELPGLLGPLLDPITRPITSPVGLAIRPGLTAITDPLLCALRPLTNPLVKPVLDPLFVCPGALPGRITLVDKLATGDAVASFSVTDWAEIGVDVPFSYIESDVGSVKEGIDIDNIRINGKLQLKDPQTAGLGFALVPFVDVPTGNADHLTANGDFNWGGLAVAEFVASKFRASLNGGYKVNDEPMSDSDETDEVLFGAGLGYLLMGEQPILGAEQSRLELIGEIFGASAEQDLFKDEYTTPVEFLAGGRFYTPSGLQAALGGGRKITDSINGPDYRIVASVGYSWQPKPPPPPPPPPPQYSKVVVTDEQIVTLEPIFFDFDKATIKAVSYPVLDEIVKVLTDRPTMKIRVESHTDSKGSDRYNQKLSERRAQATVKYLIDKGIDPTRLEAQGYGESRPIAPNATSDGSDNPEGRAKNRRSEFHITAK